MRCVLSCCTSPIAHYPSNLKMVPCLFPTPQLPCQCYSLAIDQLSSSYLGPYGDKLAQLIFTWAEVSELKRIVIEYGQYGLEHCSLGIVSTLS